MTYTLKNPHIWATKIDFSDNGLPTEFNRIVAQLSWLETYDARVRWINEKVNRTHVGTYLTIDGTVDSFMSKNECQTRYSQSPNSTHTYTKELTHVFGWPVRRDISSFEHIDKVFSNIIRRGIVSIDKRSGTWTANGETRNEYDGVHLIFWTQYKLTNDIPDVTVMFVDSHEFLKRYRRSALTYCKRI